MRTGVAASFAIAVTLCWAASAQAQVTIDASRITCDQFARSKVAPTRTVAAWLSGFYSGKRDSALIDLQTFEANLAKLEQFCGDGKNSGMLVMQAIEKLKP